MNISGLGSIGWFALANFYIVTHASAIVSIVYVPVGNLGNAADSTGYGSVSYAYNIGKYEVTNAQYGEFLNAKGASNSNGIYNAKMADYGITQNGIDGSFTYSVTGALANRPVVYVSWYDAARFANWMLNGQGSGSMETGAYTLTGNTGVIGINAGAQIYLPSENEWYKAAYYNGNTASYSLYPNGHNSITVADANFYGSGSTDVGTYSGDASFYGTFDQGGNVWEWNDAVLFASNRGLRGGSWSNTAYGSSFGSAGLYSPSRSLADPSVEEASVGFRVASVPEPTSLILTVLASMGLMNRRKR